MDGRPNLTHSRLSHGNSLAQRGAAQWLHGWVVSVDHKNLGHSVHCLRALFPARCRRPSPRHPHSARHPQQPLHLTRGLQRAVHHARHNHGVSGRHADPVRLRQLPCSAHDRRARYLSFNCLNFFNNLRFFYLSLLF